MGPRVGFVLCRSRTNKNGDDFTSEELAARHATAIHKKIDLEHSQRDWQFPGGLQESQLRYHAADVVRDRLKDDGSDLAAAPLHRILDLIGTVEIADHGVAYHLRKRPGGDGIERYDTFRVENHVQQNRVMKP